MMNNAVLTLKNISKRFGETQAVDELSLMVADGELVTLLGPSGCGKTTTLRLLAGIQRPDSGEIWQDGALVAGRGAWVPPEDRRVGLVFQDYALFPHLDVGRNVAFGLNHLPRRDRRGQVQAMLALVGLAGYEQRMPHELSGGQQQRVALARALAPEPAIMLLDEPFSNLDAALRTQVRAEVRSILRQAGTTTLFVTHDQEEALSLSDRVAVIFDGVLHQIGPPDALYTQPASEQVALFLGDANFIDGWAQGYEAETDLGPVPLLKSAQGDISVMLRPEALSIAHEDAHTPGMPAVVRWREYYGHTQRIGLALEDGRDLIVRTQSHAPFHRDDRVRVAVVGSGFAM